MCGIAGRLGPTLRDDDATRRLDAAERCLHHRGPDSQGRWRAALHDKEIAFLHVRLAIIDLTPGGAQPYTSEDGRLQLVYNGEIYNYRELRQELAGLGAQFRSESDTEVLLRAYEEWGEDCLPKLRGMFAFALWDSERRTLFAARDRLGIKPLFYAHHNDTLVFASELRPLFALEPIPRAIDERALDDYLTYLYFPSPGTIYRHVRSLPPGHALTARMGGGALTVRTRRYWAPPRSRLVVGEEEAIRLVRHELETVMRQHVLADVPLGAFLSGGLDSTTIVALMAQQSSRPVRTFCMTFGPEEQRYDEREYADIVARRYRTEHALIPVKPDVAALLPEMVRHFGQPFGNPTALLVAELSRQTRQHVTVALAGDGGDEIFLGYPRYLGLRWDARYQRLPAVVRRVIAGVSDLLLVDSQAGLHGLRRMREFLGTGSRTLDEAYTAWVGFFSREERRRLENDALTNAIGDHVAEDWLVHILDDTRRKDPAERAAQADVQSFLPANILAYSDRMSMMHSLELRVPFCDHVLVELLLSLEPDLKLRGMTTKALLRKACADLFPSRVLRRGKLGFNPPMGLWLNGPLRDVVEEMLRDEDGVMGQFFRREAIQSLVHEHRSGRRDRSLHIWSLLVFHAWFQSDRDDEAALAKVHGGAIAEVASAPAA